jgi:hypothetical protein
VALLLATCPLPNGPDWAKDIDDNAGTLIPPVSRDPDSYILNYDLQAYVPIPVEGGVPIKNVTNRRDMDIIVVWKDENDRVIPEPFNGFVLNTVYKADILLSVKNNKYFDQSISFKYPEGAVTKEPNNNFALEVRSLTTVTYNWVRAPILIDAGTVNPAVFIPAPVAGETPVRSLVTAGYTGTVEWKVGDFTTSMTGNRFGSDTDYNAVVSLYAGPGALFRGTLATGGTMVDAGTNNGDSITGIKLDFPPTAKAAVTDFDLTRYVPAPVTGGTPGKTFSAPQYEGTVTWDPAPNGRAAGSFGMGTAYTGTVTLTGASGYSLAGVEANAFTHNATVLVSNTAGSATDLQIEVTIVFPATTGVTAGPVTDLNLTPYVPPPVRGGMPVTYFYAPQYWGTVDWSEAGTSAAHSGLFQADTTYTAKLMLTAASGYTLDGVSGFTHTGGNISAAGNIVSIVFPGTTSVAAAPVDDLDLTPYVSAPVRGGTPAAFFFAPQYWGRVEWKAGGAAHSGLFAGGTAYTATVTLTAASGCTFTGAGPFTHTGASSINTTGNMAAIVFPETTGVTAAPVDDLNLTPYVPAPVRGGNPAAFFFAPQYWGRVEWKETISGAAHSGFFAGGTAYTATVTLTAVSGYTLDGVSGFTHTGASSINTTGNMATINFKAVPLGDIDLTSQVPAPVTGGTPVKSFSTAGYSGTVSWQAAPGKSLVRFQGETVYKAVITLAPAAGFTFPAGFTVTHSGSSTIVHTLAKPLEVGIIFPATGAFWEYNGPFSGSTAPGKGMDSAIDIIGRAKDESWSSLSLKLFWEPETVNLAGTSTDIGSSLSLTDGNSPAAVTIDGGGKPITQGTGSGSVITVGKGVTLTLRDITFKGRTDNTSPFIMVEEGGTLILETGAIIKDNGSSGVLTENSGSGVVMYNGARIEHNGASGVSVQGGYFTMYGGIISGNTNTGNGGGVYISSGQFTKTGGTIYGNDVAAPLANTATGNGHAAYVVTGSKKRNATAGPGVSLTSGTSASEGWE